MCECNLGFTRDSDMCEGKESCCRVFHKRKLLSDIMGTKN